MTANDSGDGSAALDAGDPCCPLCGSEMEVIERVGSRWWHCDGEDHSYSREIET